MLGLRVGLENRRTSGENKVLLENLKASGRMVQSITTDVRPRAQKYDSECDKELYFH
jgi:hypothetical protein